VGVDNEFVFRGGLIILFFLAPAIQVYYGRKVRPGQPAYGRDKAALKREGWMILLPHTAALILMGTWLVAHAARLASVRWSTVPLPVVLRWLGIILAALGLVGLAVVHQALGRYWSWNLRIQEGHRLVTEGVYARVRHPMYTALFTHTVALGLASSNWLFMLFCAVRMAALYQRIAREEAMLIGQFGDEYRQYMRRTGRFLPRL
jgi:protein-S-isoprenylcysteine O-methyltransferase Ste14